MKKKTTIFHLLLITLMSPFLHLHSMADESLETLKKRKKQRDIKTEINEGDKKIEQCLMDNSEDQDACLDLIIQRKKHSKNLSDLENGFLDDDRFESISEALSDAVKESTQLRQTLDGWKQESAEWRKKIPSWQQTARVSGSFLILFAGLIPLIIGIKKLDDSDCKQGKYSTTLGACLVTLGICGLYYFSSTK